MREIIEDDREWVYDSDRIMMENEEEIKQLREALKTVWDIVFKNIRISDIDGLPNAYREYKKLLNVSREKNDD